MKACCRAFLEEQFGAGEPVVEEIYGEYVGSMKGKAEEAIAAAAAGNWRVLDAVAHAAKGNALMAGDQESADVAIELRGAAKLEDKARAEALSARLKELVATL
ncbi:MAG: hypothetical protein IKQ55_02550 [Kiritimatiellae bacterium]|nr:hypothetical protein [Kiritimatiellia bacterium]